MSKCTQCGSEHFKSKGIRTRADGSKVQRVVCSDCGRNGQRDIEEVKPPVDKNQEIFKSFVEDVEPFKQSTRFVITAVQNDTDTHQEFFDAILNYCELNGAQLIVIPVRYANPNAYSRLVGETWDDQLEPYMMDKVLDLGMLKILGDLKVQATAGNPLSGLEPLTQGKTTIVGHGQIQMKSCPRLSDDAPIILTTTGSLSKNNYSDTKAGYIANFHHSNGAVIVELTDDKFHLRHINAADDGSFIDLGWKYTGSSVGTAKTLALVMGDEHAWFTDSEVREATHGADGIVQSLKPEILVRHDIFDSYSISHHHKSLSTRYKKIVEGMTLEKELDQCYKYIVDTTPDFTKSYIVSSNHNNHLKQWLEDDNNVKDLVNARTFNRMRAEMLGCIEHNVPYDPFQTYIEDRLLLSGDAFEIDVEFLGDKSFKVAEIEISMHGDRGINGSRGSAKSLSRLAHKTVIGHSHTPCIERGCYQVGTSTPLRLEYTSGPTTWMQTHCAIYENGKRQLISVIGGEWRG